MSSSAVHVNYRIGCYSDALREELNTIFKLVETLRCGSPEILKYLPGYISDRSQISTTCFQLNEWL